MLLGSLALDCQLATEPRSDSRHNGDVACRQAREPREKNYVSPLSLISWIYPGDWSSYYCHRFIPRRGGIKITYLSFTFRKLVVTSSLVYLVLRACIIFASVACHLVELFSVASL
jgi:hypothetical protein